MARSNRARRFEESREPTLAREELERRWRAHLTQEPRLATLVTAQGNAREPFHRWLPYRQGFSPGLVRLFLTETGRGLADRPILDPFSGSGTTITECSRQRREAIGVEAMPALAFLAGEKFERTWTPLPPLNGLNAWEAIADRLTLPLHQAALMIAEARRHTGAGSLNRSAPSIADSLESVARTMAEDFQNPLPLRNPSLVGDARELKVIECESIAALLTSPPYLSRYDYVQTNDPIETVFRCWHDSEEPAPRELQVRASPRGRKLAKAAFDLHPAVRETYEVLTAASQPRHAAAVANYFSDMQSVLNSVHRVLLPNAPAWLIIGGVRLKDVYVPADLIVVEMAQQSGYLVEAIRVARELNPVRRKFGSVGHLAPRETLIALRRA